MCLTTESVRGLVSSFSLVWKPRLSGAPGESPSWHFSLDPDTSPLGWGSQVALLLELDQALVASCSAWEGAGGGEGIVTEGEETWTLFFSFLFLSKCYSFCVD